MNNTSEFINATLYHSLKPSFPNILEVKLIQGYNLIIKYDFEGHTLFTDVYIADIFITNILDYFIKNQSHIFKPIPNISFSHFLISNIRNSLCFNHNNLDRVSTTIILLMIKKLTIKHNLKIKQNLNNLDKPTIDILKLEITQLTLAYDNAKIQRTRN